MTIRVSVRGEEVFDKPYGQSQVEVSAGWSQSEHVVRLSVLGQEERTVRISGRHLEVMLEELATYEIFSGVFMPEFVDAARARRARPPKDRIKR